MTFKQIIKTGPGFYLLLDDKGQLWRGEMFYDVNKREEMKVKVVPVALG